MAYTPQVWTNSPSTASPLSAARLNTVEGGIKDASDRLDSIEVGTGAHPITGLFYRDGYASIQAAIDAAGTAGGGTVYLSHSEDITTGLTLPTTTPVRLHAAPGVRLRATAAMTAMITKPSGFCSGIAIHNLDLDANRFADRCIDIEQALRLSIRGGVWSNPLVAVADFGRSGGQVYEMDWRDTRLVGIEDTRAGATPAQMPGYGYRFGANVTDSVIENVVVKNAAVGVEDGGNVNVHDKVHVFSYPYGATNYVGTAGFSITGSINRLVNCYADTQTLGFDLVGARNTLVAPMFFWPSDYAYAGDLLGVRIAGVGCTVIGGAFRLPNSGLTGWPVQIETGIRPTVLVGMNVYGTGWHAFQNLVGTNNTPFVAACAWDGGLVPITLDLAGGTLTTASALVSGAAGVSRSVEWRTGTSRRFSAGADGTAEGGLATGSNWGLSSYKDDGTFGFVVAQAQRYSGMFITARALLRLRATQTLATAGAVTIDAFASNQHQIILNANATSSSIGAASSLGATGMQTGQELTISWAQDATGGRTYVWPTNCRFAGGAAPSDTTLNTRTSVTFSFEGVWCEVSRAVAVPRF